MKAASMPYSLREITPDGVSWTDPYLEHEELNAMFLELKEG
jgi:hypothetical protein